MNINTLPTESIAFEPVGTTEALGDVLMRQGDENESIMEQSREESQDKSRLTTFLRSRLSEFT